MGKYLRAETKHCQLTRAATLLVVIAGVIGYSALGIDVSNLKLARFKARSPRTETAEGWEIEGNQAVMNGTRVQLDSARLKLFLKDGREAIVTASACQFDERDKILRSSEQIFLNHPSFKLEGTGCTLFSDEQRLVIHSQVRIVLSGSATGEGCLFSRLKRGTTPPEDGSKPPIE